MRNGRTLLTAAALLALIGIGCGQEEERSTDNCAQAPLSPVTDSVGDAFVFSPDPLTSSGVHQLEPSDSLDEYRSSVTLSRLGGRGVLEGDYVDVRNGLHCGESFGAFSATNDFRYSHREEGFQEAMTYHFGDQFRSFLDSVGVLPNREPMKIVAHCMRADNAYYVRFFDGAGLSIEKVCLGDSAVREGASYSDDATVVLHEIQHGTTTNTYHPSMYLNQFWYDEAGALNEAISDAVTLTYLAPSTRVDPKVFSRWALGRFIPSYSSLRGAHACPTYDSDYPLCRNFKPDASGFSAEKSTISMVYPDGLGWPYANNFGSDLVLKTLYESYLGQEEIHNDSLILNGAIFDVYELITKLSGEERARKIVTQVLHEAIANLPKRTLNSVSPVTFVGLARLMVDRSAAVGFNTDEREALKTAMRNRGLFEAATLPSGWASIGPGEDGNAGMKIVDEPNRLKSWLLQAGGTGSIVPQGAATGLNSKLDPNEIVAVWFDIQNDAALTAGGLELVIKSLNSNVRFLPLQYNYGFISDFETQIRYFKVNGTDIREALEFENETHGVPLNNHYFKTNPFFSHRMTTAVFVRVEPNASGVAQFEVKVRPTNGPEQVLLFSAPIN